jgi:TonB family protein
LDKMGLPERRSVVPTVAAARIIDLKPARRAPAHDAGEASPATLGAISPSFRQWRAERETDSGSAAAIAVAASSGHPILDQAALDAVQGWRFNPATRAGVPVAGITCVPIQFLLFD